MLNNHPSLAIPHESAFITIYFRRLARYGDFAVKDNARRLFADVARHPLFQRGKLLADPEAVLARPISSYADFVDAIFRCSADALGKPRWGAKTPFYTPDHALISSIISDATQLHPVRDGGDVVLSTRS